MILVLLIAVSTVWLAGCSPAKSQASANVQRGRALVSWYGCETCHSVPAPSPVRGNVGPPLAGIAKRAYLAGRLPNTPDNMLRWIQDPRQTDPQTLMPELGVTEQDGRDIVAFLYTLR
jgi:cytochrome c2